LQRDAQFQVEELENKAEQLLQLHDEDREALLFAARCFTQAAAPVRHGLAVAAEMIDLVAPTRLPRPVRRSIAACAMVHDLGKALYDEELRSTAVLTLQQRRDVPAHVFALERSLSACPWLSANVAKAVVWSINERLDGSGYPAGLQGEEIGELARAAMVVDVIDAMRRGRADRPAWKVAHIYANLRRRPTQFDRNWVNRYSRRFGSWPIGTLVRFESHALGWIRRLDAAGRPKQVQLAHDLRPPEALDAEVLDGERLEQLGAPSEQLPVAF
jgi:HD-GYP domain-containing protein (c-di-GMP phosphodiesterase class II)